MRVLHIAPHLGGGVGKAHASMGAFLPREIERTYVLLEEPRERRYLTEIELSGARVLPFTTLDDIAAMASRSDIVQFEYWNHPRLFECLARCAFPAMRSLFWSHIAGLSRPLIQPGLVEEAGRFVFTTKASLVLPGMPQHKVAAINSGFGYPQSVRYARTHRVKNPDIAYLGTVDFVKMHPGFFEAIDRLEGADIRVSVWGAADPSGEAVAQAQAMRHSERVKFCGETSDPAAALSDADIFFYPLQRDHYGTAENALVEAMSLGLVPLVLNNAAEMAIVQDGKTGFVARSIEECTVLLQKLCAAPQLRQKLSQNAVRHVADTRSPVRAARDFVSLWCAMMDQPARVPDFRAAVGASPADWYISTQCQPGAAWGGAVEKSVRAAKGTLAHFESVFADDVSLARLRQQTA